LEILSEEFVLNGSEKENHCKVFWVKAIVAAIGLTLFVDVDYKILKLFLIVAQDR